MNADLPGSIIKRLKELANSNHRSMTSRVADILPLIEDLKHHGVTNKQILSVLKEEGLVMSLKTFESILHRLRKREWSIGAKTGIAGKCGKGGKSGKTGNTATTSSFPDRGTNEMDISISTLKDLRQKSHDVADEFF